MSFEKSPGSKNSGETVKNEEGKIRETSPHSMDADLHKIVLKSSEMRVVKIKYLFYPENFPAFPGIY